MALNLNKGDEDNSKPSTEKKGLNLSKSGDNEKVKPNLTKYKPVKADNSSLSNTQTGFKKKSPVLIITLAVIIIGIGVFWFMNNKENDSAVKGDVENSSDISEETVAPAPSSEDQPAIETVEAIDNSIDETNEQITTTNGNNDVQETTSVNTNNSSTSQSNIITSTTSSPKLQGTIEEKARQVISGAFGNGADRKNALGSEYAAIQAKVNEIYRNGIN